MKTCSYKHSHHIERYHSEQQDRTIIVKEGDGCQFLLESDYIKPTKMGEHYCIMHYPYNKDGIDHRIGQTNKLFTRLKDSPSLFWRYILRTLKIDHGHSILQIYTTTEGQEKKEQDKFKQCIQESIQTASLNTEVLNLSGVIFPEWFDSTLLKETTFTTQQIHGNPGQAKTFPFVKTIAINECVFYNSIYFSEIKFAHFHAKKTYFASDVNFKDCQFEKACFEKSTFSKDAIFSREPVQGDLIKNSSSSGSIYFPNATFKGKVDLSNQRFTGRVNFDGAKFKGIPPKLTNATFLDMVSFIGVKFKNPDKKHDDHILFQTLRNLMIEQSNHQAARTFFAWEQRYYRKHDNVTLPNAILSCIYDWLSFYGENWWSPWIWLFIMNGGFYFLYLYLVDPSWQLCDHQDIFRFTMEQIAKPLNVWSWRYPIPDIPHNITNIQNIVLRNASPTISARLCDAHSNSE